MEQKSRESKSYDRWRSLSQIERTRLASRIREWEKLIPLADRSIAKGDFKTGKRVLEGLRNSVIKTGLNGPGAGSTRVRVSYKDEIGEDGLAFCYEKLGELDKAAERYLEVDAPYMAGFTYEKLGELDKAAKCFKQALNYYSGKTGGYNGRLLSKARESLTRIEAIKRERGLGRLEKVATTMTSIFGILSGLFFLSPNLTGNAITNMTNSTSSILGAGLLIIGLIAGFFWLKAKKKK